MAFLSTVCDSITSPCSTSFRSHNVPTGQNGVLHLLHQLQKSTNTECLFNCETYASDLPFYFFFKKEEIYILHNN